MKYRFLAVGGDFENDAAATIAPARPAACLGCAIEVAGRVRAQTVGEASSIAADGEGVESGIDTCSGEFINRPARRPVNRAGLVYDQAPVRTAKITAAAEAMQHSFTPMMKPEEDPS